MRRFILIATLLHFSQPGVAEPAPRCTSAREGQVACLDGKLCACRHDPGGSLTGRPAGTRWDCGALRPACAVPPPDAAQPLPDRMPPFFPMPPSAPAWR